MILVGKIHILCGALADQAAREDLGGGIFTRALVRRLRADPALLTLPLDLSTWQKALPADLLANHGIEILDRRETLVPGENRQRSGDSQGQKVTAV